MNNRYFDAFEFQQILKLMDVDPFSSLNLYEQYLNKYPNDYSAWLLYCSNLIILGKLEEAEKVYNHFNEEYSNNQSLKDTERAKRIKESQIFTGIKLLSYQEKYEELYKFCAENINTVMLKKFNDAFFYSKKKTGRLNFDKRDENSYLFSQIVQYDEKTFLEHIKKHLCNDDENSKKESISIFEQNFPVEKVIEEIKKYIPSDKKLLWGFYDNVYYFKYNSCGRVNNRVVDYFKVVCFNNTNNFITMCPVVGCENLPYEDLNYLISYDESPKVKRLSQIEKFNKKFNKK